MQKEHNLLYEAVKINDTVNIAFLLNNSTEKDKYDALHLAALKGFNDSIAIILDSGIQPNSIYNLLNVVTRKNNLEGVQLFIEHGVNEQQLLDKALIIACEKGYVELAKFLIEKEANIKPQNNRPLCKAAQNNHIGIIKLLLNSGSMVDGYQCKPLFDACYYGSYEAASFLLARGANPKGNENCNMPIYYANGNNHTNIVELLESYGANLKEYKDKPLDKNKMKEFISILKEVKEVLPTNNGELTESIMKAEVMLPILPDGPRKKDAQFNKFLNNIVYPDKKIKKPFKPH